jgi:uncharacterized protein
VTRTSPPLKLRVRAFDFTGVPSDWLGGDPWLSRFFDAFSTLLPVGERFVVDAARRAAEQVSDAALDELVKVFAQQEGVHSREHRRYNERLKAEGIDVDGWDRSQKRTMWRVLGLRDARIPLAVTVAIEHITAVMGEIILANDTLANAHPEMNAFWSWHWAEEIEHKGAAFDVYTRAGGGPDLRRVVMAWALVLLLIRLSARFGHLLRRDRKLFDRAAWRTGLPFLFGRKGLVAQLAPHFRAFFRKDFHPWAADTYHLVETWEASNVNGRSSVATAS